MIDKLGHGVDRRPERPANARQVVAPAILEVPQHGVADVLGSSVGLGFLAIGHDPKEVLAEISLAQGDPGQPVDHVLQVVVVADRQTQGPLALGHLGGNVAGVADRDALLSAAVEGDIQRVLTDDADRGEEHAQAG